MATVTHQFTEDRRRRKEPVLNRFQRKFRVTPGCWIWGGYKNQKGYGRMRVGLKDILAHRLSYEMYIGPIPEGKLVCHRCDNPACVNPDHLWIGTDRENTDDKMNKGRWSAGAPRQGVKHPLAILTDDQVYAIRADPRPMPQIAKDFNVSYSCISAIKKRDIWGHLEPRNDEVKSVDGRVRPPRLTRDQQMMVRSDGRSHPVIAAEYGISPSVVSVIKRGVGCYANLK